MMRAQLELIVMRLVDMHRIHPQQDNSHVCSRCGERVGVYPSGQAVLRERPSVVLVCVPCAMAGGAPNAVTWAAPFDEIAQESRDSHDVGKHDH
jgi:hypothetical protein